MEGRIYARVIGDDALRDVILMFSVVNEVNMSALETLEAINARLQDVGITLHLSEVKRPVMDRLMRSGFPDVLTGNFFCRSSTHIMICVTGRRRISLRRETTKLIRIKCTHQIFRHSRLKDLPEGPYMVGGR